MIIVIIICIIFWKTMHFCSEFSKEKEKIDRTLLFRKERQEKREQQDYLGYKEWIEFAGIKWYLKIYIKMINSKIFKLFLSNI